MCVSEPADSFEQGACGKKRNPSTERASRGEVDLLETANVGEAVGDIFRAAEILSKHPENHCPRHTGVEAMYVSLDDGVPTNVLVRVVSV